MSQSTAQPWKKAAFETLLWLLNEHHFEAIEAYWVLRARLAAFFRSRLSEADPEELATDTLERVAKLVYLRLTGLRSEDLDRPEIHHEVPLGIAPELYATERGHLTALTSYTAVDVFRAAKRDRLPLDVLEISRLELEKDIREGSAKEPSRILQWVAAPKPAPVQFTAYYPRFLDSRNWSTILAYMHVADAIKAVQADSQRRLGDKDQTTWHKTAISEVSIARGARIIAVPQSEELEFNPPQVAFTWLEDYHCVEFRCRVRESTDACPQSAAVSVAFFVAPIVAAEISFAITIGSDDEHEQRTDSVTARPYQRVFVSYSHRGQSNRRTTGKGV